MVVSGDGFMIDGGVRRWSRKIVDRVLDFVDQKQVFFYILFKIVFQ